MILKWSHCKPDVSFNFTRLPLHHLWYKVLSLLFVIKCHFYNEIKSVHEHKIKTQYWRRGKDKSICINMIKIDDNRRICCRWSQLWCLIKKEAKPQVISSAIIRQIPEFVCSFLDVIFKYIHEAKRKIEDEVVCIYHQLLILYPPISCFMLHCTMSVPVDNFEFNISGRGYQSIQLKWV